MRFLDNISSKTVLEEGARPVELRAWFALQYKSWANFLEVH